MFSLYLFAAIAGGVLVLVSLIGGSTDADGDGSPDVGDGDGGHALSDGQQEAHALSDGQHGGDAAAHADHAAAAAHAPGGLSIAASWLFSIQLWTYLLAFGGLTGLLLRTVGHVAEPMAGLGAGAVGLGSALLARRVFRALSAHGDSGTVAQETLVGSTAKVLIPAAAGGTGKVRLEARGQTVDLLAQAQDGSALVEGEEVVVLDLNDGVAAVTRDLAEVARPRALPSRAAAARLAAPQKKPPQRGG